MATEFNTGTDASLNEAVKTRYEANDDTNAFTDAEKSKLAGIPANAEPNAIVSVNGATGAVVIDADRISDAATANKFASAAQLSKLDDVEPNATADQTGAEIVLAIDAELGGSTWQSGGSGGGSGPVDVVSNVATGRILGRVAAGSGNSEELSATEVRSLLNVADGATANTGALANADTVGSSEIQDGAVTTAKLAQLPASSLMGRSGASTGQVEILSPAAARAILNVLSATNLASGASGEGASLVGIEDAGAFTTASDVESALQEIYAILGTQGDIVTQDAATFVRKSEREVIVFDAGGASDAARPQQASDKTVVWFNHGATLPVNMGAFDIAAGQEYGLVSVNTQTGTAYTLGIDDTGISIDMNNAAANVVTIPNNASVAFEVGACISITQLGAGTTSVQGDAGVALNGAAAGIVTINNQFSGVVLRKVSADEWIAQGDVS